MSAARGYQCPRCGCPRLIIRMERPANDCRPASAGYMTWGEAAEPEDAWFCEGCGANDEAVNGANLHHNEQDCPACNPKKDRWS